MNKYLWGFKFGDQTYYGEGETQEEGRKDLPKFLGTTQLQPMTALDLHLVDEQYVNEDGDLCWRKK